MHLLYADETSLDPFKHEFFVYGGLAIPCATAGSLHQEIERVRRDFKIPAPFVLKFNPGPDHLAHGDFVALKRALMQAAANAGCTFLITISHHKILKSVDEARRGEINRIAFHFNSFLAGANGFGLIIIDRFTDKQIDAHLREKFSVGLKGMPYSDTMRLDRIVGFHYGAIGQAHFCSLIDVLMGSTRFVIDAFSGADDKQLATATAILGQMEPLFSKTTHGLVSNLCINFTPKVVKIEAYRSRYSALKDFFTRCGISPEQAISAVRTY